MGEKAVKEEYSPEQFRRLMYGEWLEECVPFTHEDFHQMMRIGRDKRMSSNPRDTQFAGFAKAMWAELEANIDFIPESRARRATFLPMVEGIIARRASDLVTHTVEHTLEYLHECGHELSTSFGKRIPPSIPDLTQFVEE